MLQVSVDTVPVMGKLSLTGRSHVDVTMDVTQIQGTVSMVSPVYKDNLHTMPGQDRPVELVMWTVFGQTLSIFHTYKGNISIFCCKIIVQDKIL